MAEVIGIVGSLVGISSAAISLTTTLYDFGTTTSAARDHVDLIGKNVSFYSDVLELLVEQLEHDRPIHSKKALALAERIHDHSYDLFDRIEDLIPDRQRMRDQLSFIQRVAWNFKKTRVNLLVGELENLKSTVQLLVQVLCAARQLHAYKNTDGKSHKRKKDRKRQEAQRQYSRAENVLVDWQRTQDNVPILQEAAEKDDQQSLPSDPTSSKSEAGPSSRTSAALIKVQDNTLAVIQAATASANASTSERRALVLHNTANWVDDLLHEWTVPPEQHAGDASTATVNAEETSAVILQYKKQIAELEERLSRVHSSRDEDRHRRDVDVGQDVEAGTQGYESGVPGITAAQKETYKEKIYLASRVKSFEEAQYSSLIDLEADHALLSKVVRQEISKGLDKMEASNPELRDEREGFLIVCDDWYRELRKTLNDAFARHRSKIIAQGGEIAEDSPQRLPDRAKANREGTCHYGNPPKGYTPYHGSPLPSLRDDEYVYYAPLSETTPIRKHDRKFRYSTPKDEGYYSPPGYPSPGFYETYRDYTEPLTQDSSAREKKKGESKKLKSKTTSGGPEAPKQKTDQAQQGRSARNSGRPPNVPIRRYTEPRERKAVEQLKAEVLRKYDDQPYYYEREREEKEQIEKKEAEELKKREEQLLWKGMQDAIAACM